MLTSSASAGLSSGRMPGRQLASRLFPAPGGPIISEVVPAGGGDLERALGDLLPFDLPEVGAARRFLDFARLRLGQPLRALQVVEQPDQARRGDDRHAARPARLGALRRRADQALVPLAGMKRGEQHAGRGDDAPVERQLADRDPVRQLLGIGHPHRREQRERDRQVVVAALLGQVGRRQVDRDDLRRQREAHRGERRVHPLAALVDRLVGQADDVELAAGPGAIWHCTSTGARIEPQVGHCRNECDQAAVPFAQPR